MCQRVDEKRRGEQIDYRTEQMAQQVRQERNPFLSLPVTFRSFFGPFALWDCGRVPTLSCCSRRVSMESGRWEWGVCQPERCPLNHTQSLSCTACHTHYSNINTLQPSTPHTPPLLSLSASIPELLSHVAPATELALSSSKIIMEIGALFDQSRQ